tara:strand:- start:9 stop:389 length:381 start_codon:yes stop_codon:yes gene_type:complete
MKNKMLNKSAKGRSPMQSNYSSPMKADIDAGELKTVEVSGGKKTKQGEFMQDERGSTITGSSVEHNTLRKKRRDNKTKKGAPALTSEERARLRELDMLTEKAYKKMQSGLPGQSNPTPGGGPPAGS